ncbi:glycosyltransferase family 2 protein [Gammaproteobacteria bacterium]|nr:glycosyltransferase family 2 protein [Gammaproteobacteria bacterium]
MKTDSPLVSILMPAFNAERFIEEAIESALAQSYANIEVIISDDFSSDDTPTIIKSFADRHPDIIKYYPQSKNLGVTSNCNFILERCRGEYICFTAGDDILEADCISKAIYEMEVNVDNSIVFHEPFIINADSERLPYSVSYHRHFGNLALILKNGFYLKCNGMVVKKSSIPDSRYDNNIKFASDIDFVMRILGTENSYQYLPSGLSRYRKHPQGITTNRAYECRMDNINSYRKLGTLYPEYFDQFQRLISVTYRSMRHEDGLTYQQCLALALKHNRFDIKAICAYIVNVISCAHIEL